MKMIDVIEEQVFNKWKDKITNAAQKAGTAIQTGVHNVSQKIADVTQKQPTQQTQQPKPQGRNYEQLKAEWSKVNTDTSSTQGFGEGNSKNESGARQIGNFQASVIVRKKANKSVSVRIIDDATFQTADGIYNYLVLMDIDNY